MFCRTVFGLTLVILSAAANDARPAPPTFEPLERYEFLQIQMGVPFKIALYAPSKAIANRAAVAAYRRIKQLNAVLSDYDPDSELMQLCRLSGLGKAVKVSPELYFVLSRSTWLSNETDGAFDVSVGPIVRLWRIARRKKQMPAANDLTLALKKVGYQAIRLKETRRTVELLREGMRLDLGGIAKGYAGDEALRILRRFGITRALIDGSGDIVVGDAPPGKSGWRIEVAMPAFTHSADSRKPKSATNNSRRFLELKNAAVATSGDAYQFVEIDGKRYSHIVDSKTGLGLQVRSSVTVIAPDGTTADSLASAVSVLGPQRGLKLIRRIKRTEALIIVLEKNRPATFTSDGFSCYVQH